MTALTRSSSKLTHAGAMLILEAAVRAADAMGVPQCIAVVDEGANLLAFCRMDGAKVLSIPSCQAKAATAAASGKPTGTAPAESEIKLAVATDGRNTNLKGGLPIIVDGVLVGGIGVGSGTGDQDRDVAAAALAAVGLAA
ncbi:GlcG/HbpS family heme-binding protein [Humitalea sp. 24SJ18S-53]|uniref:GlcG/HbpS family heme-binding protein n=1 Tax=Humitalea sp. 24SJ18S-53 TaxID=3422307 RepID=UPI003D6757F5